METIGKFVVMILILFVVGIFLALPTMWLWNWLMPAIFGLIKIGFWQALGLNILAGILFKNNSSGSK